MHNSFVVLLISADDGVISLCKSVFAAEGHSLSVLPNLNQAITALSSGSSYEAVMLDIALQTSINSSLLEALAHAMDVSRLQILSPMSSTYWRSDAERLGITNILWRPLQRQDVLRLLDTLADKASLQHICPSSENACKRSSAGCYVEELPNDRYFLAACPAMKKIHETVCLLAAVDVPVLILGESGVGKDVVATLLHKHSLRSKACYMSLNCAALPPDLLESELFGYEAGAFTGAIKSKPGKFELADHGTLLLDEIGEMSAMMQAKLLHVLQDGRYSRLGARSETRVDVRVIAATNVDIENAILRNTFREDLYYRISTFTVNIPPLRERKDEIPFLMEQMLMHQAGNLGRDPVYISPSVMSLMQDYHWPGNLRELYNYVIRIQVLGSTDAAVADLEERIRGHYVPHSLCSEPSSDVLHDVPGMRSIVRSLKDQTESRLIQQALDEAGWNRRHAAIELHISYRSLLYKIQQYGLIPRHLPQHANVVQLKRA